MTGGGGAAVGSRVPRMLNLVPYLLARPGVRVDQVAADFGVSEKQLRSDLELLWMCGLPGYGPGDLVDLSFAGDTVTVTEDVGLRRPLRLTTAEAAALLVALRALAEGTGLVDSDVVRRALAKLEDAVGAPGTPTGVEVALGPAAGPAPGGPVPRETTAAVRTALDRRRALRIRYYTASRDAVGERVVDPMRLLLVEGREYLEAWCRSAEAVRLFRMDRVEEVHELDEPAELPPAARPTDVSAGLFRAEPGQREAVLLLEPDARWVGEYYPVAELTELTDGRAEVRMRFTDDAWMVRLVLGLGGAARVLRPVELRAAVADRARAAVLGEDGADAPGTAAPDPPAGGSGAAGRPLR